MLCVKWASEQAFPQLPVNREGLGAKCAHGSAADVATVPPNAKVITDEDGV